MYRSEKTVYKQGRDNPSFSSTLLDKIYRSIDDGDSTKDDFKFYRDTMQNKQHRGSIKCNKSRGYGGEEEDEEMSSLRHACLIEKWMENKANEKKHVFSDFVRKSRHEYDRDDHGHDGVFFSSTSTSTSSESGSGRFSSSDTESMHVTKPKSSCFVTSRLKPVRTSESIRSEKPVKTEKKTEQRKSNMLDDYHYSSAPDYKPKLRESLFSSKSRATKIYSDLKNVKHPISPGGRLANFINSLFTTRARGTPSSIVSCDDERKLKPKQVSTCSSASSFSRSCLSKNSPSTRERLRNGVKRNVRFCPVSIIVDEDCRPCGQKCLYEEEDSSSSVPVAVWKIRKSPSRKVEEEIKFQVSEKARRVEEMAAKFLKEYHLNQRKEYFSRGSRSNYIKEEMDEDEDDAASYSSSDLFDLDHLVLIGNKKYREELPVYETTHVETNRAIANGLTA
ncbi:hypothetical protein F3Y22_tig00110557pilonHSYRG00292 [Hibiscus syriacus]|uniref:Protein BIG GRAIN 1-like A n=1 Tax=Hibiscus syriacus TaxID=106335 RepID=A0A6A3A8U0_HIBSY|nr:protein BIG GRAIN 1-like A [Hibiscus syriacus]KAE8700376.1 hypothetical protein F3Y22_tig00110557pilonHSYRG00292 [Hibiscus syriacus]